MSNYHHVPADVAEGTIHVPSLRIAEVSRKTSSLGRVSDHKNHVNMTERPQNLPCDSSITITTLAWAYTHAYKQTNIQI